MRDRAFRPVALGCPDELVAELELQPVERLGLELADALARQPELLADRLERCGLAAEAEPELDDPPLPLGQIGHRALNALAAYRVDGLLGRVRGRLVGEEIAELGVALGTEALVQRDRVDRVERLDDMLSLEAGRPRGPGAPPPPPPPPPQH